MFALAGKPRLNFWRMFLVLIYSDLLKLTAMLLRGVEGCVLCERW